MATARTIRPTFSLLMFPTASHTHSAARAPSWQEAGPLREDIQRGGDAGSIRGLMGLRCETRTAERDPASLAEPLPHGALR